MVSPAAKAGVVLVSLVILAAALFGLWGWVDVDEGHEGVHLEQSATSGEVYEPGWHWHFPIGNDHETLETRPVTLDMTGDDAITVITEDGQDVYVDVTVRYRVDDAVQMYEEYRSHGQARDRLVHPTVRSDLREEASSISAREIISEDGRQDLEDTALSALQENSQGSGITIEAVQVRNVDLNEEFSDQLERVEIEETERDRKIIEAEADAEAERTRAEGEADAMETRNEAITDAILELEQIEAYDEGTVFVVEGNQSTLINAEGE